MASRTWRDPWLIGASVWIGIACLMFLSSVGVQLFGGNGLYLLGAQTMVLVLAAALIVGVVKWRRLPPQAILAGVAFATISFLVTFTALMVYLIRSQCTEVC